MIRVILGALIGFFLSVPVLSLIQESDLYDYIYSETVDTYFSITLAVTLSLVGGYVGSKLSHYHTNEKQAGRNMNKTAEYAGKIFGIFIILFSFVLMMALDTRGGHPAVLYVWWVALVLPIISSMFAIRAILQIHKTHEMGMFISLSVLILSIAFYSVYLIEVGLAEMEIFRSLFG